MWRATAIALLVLCGCASKPPRLPSGLEVVAEEEPPPSSDEIRAAQERLTHLGLYDGAIDGELGARTRVALARFQRVSGMQPTGRLDRVTIEALERETTAPRSAVASGALGAPGRPREGAVLPSASRLLAEETQVPAQPPPGALCDALAEARTILEEARRDVEDRLVRPAGSLAQGGAVPPGRVREAAHEGALPARDRAGSAGADGEEGAAELERELRVAERRLADAREAAFDQMIDARRAGGWALLPESLAVALERELAARSLLLRAPDGRLGPDAAAAIAWVQRSHGGTPTGVATIGVLEDLGIDPTPMYEDDAAACGGVIRR